MKARQDIVENLSTEQEGYGRLPSEVADELEKFQDEKLGVIFHWGLYAVAGIVESWQLSEEDSWARKRPWRNNLDQLRKDYWSLDKIFEPNQFNPAHWAKLCQKAGFKYMIFTTKHHDGFNMYDTQLSDYKVTGTDCPYHKAEKGDLFGQTAAAFQAAGLSVGAYYSKADWHHPAYWEPGKRPKGRYASYDPLEKPERWAEFNRFVEGQLQEICTNYGKIDILWLDGGWVNSANNEQLNMSRLSEAVRKQQPQLLIVDRTIGGEYENYVTPERKVPEELPRKVWESNIPLAKNWGYVPNDDYKSFEEILTLLVQIVSKGGNLLLGIGPKPDGTLPTEAVALMEQLGQWLDIYGAGIYGTRRNTVMQIEDWYFTKKDRSIYAYHINSRKQLELELDLEQLAVSKGKLTIRNMKTNEFYTAVNGKINLKTTNQQEFITGIEIKVETEGQEQ